MLEFSTVSKVLRTKEMYLEGVINKYRNGNYTDQKHPVLNRRLGNYIQNKREHSIPVADTDAMDRIRQYAPRSPSHRAILAKLIRPRLNKFKQRYFIDTAGSLRRASEPIIADEMPVTARFQGTSPPSPSAHTSAAQSVSLTDDGSFARGYHSSTYQYYSFHLETSLPEIRHRPFPQSSATRSGHLASYLMDIFRCSLWIQCLKTTRSGMSLFVAWKWNTPAKSIPNLLGLG